MFHLANAQKCGISFKNKLNESVLDGNFKVLFDNQSLFSGHNDSFNKIVAGHETIPHKWPWMAALVYRGYQICGGSLIDQFYVLSAAHCFGKSKNPHDYQILLNAHNLLDMNFDAYYVSKITIHPLYDTPLPMAHDVALVRLSSAAKLDDNVNLVCLPNGPPNPGSKCVVTGWGRLVEGGYPSNVLQELVVPIWSNNYCNSPKIYNGHIHPTMLCAGYEQGGRGVCQGDSGGPLVCYIDQQWQLHGVVSWGGICAAPLKPGVYARVTFLKHWIVSEMEFGNE